MPLLRDSAAEEMTLMWQAPIDWLHERKRQDEKASSEDRGLLIFGGIQLAGAALCLACAGYLVVTNLRAAIAVVVLLLALSVPMAMLTYASFGLRSQLREGRLARRRSGQQR